MNAETIHLHCVNSTSDKTYDITIEEAAVIDGVPHYHVFAMYGRRVGPKQRADLTENALALSQARGLAQRQRLAKLKKGYTEVDRTGAIEQEREKPQTVAVANRSTGSYTAVDLALDAL